MTNDFGSRSSKPVTVFLGFLIIFTSLTDFLLIGFHYPPAFGRLMMWSPGLAALATLFVFKRNIGTLGWGWGQTKYQLQSYLIPLGYIFTAYLFIWGLGLAGFYNSDYVNEARGWYNLAGAPDAAVIAVLVLLEGTTRIFFSLSTALGEEIGWRGFLVPELSKKMPFLGVALASGAIWAVWHYPL